MKFLSTKSGMERAIGGPLGRTAAADGASVVGLAGGGGGGGGAGANVTSTGVQAPLPTVNSRSNETKPSRSQCTRTRPGFGIGTMAVPAAPVVNSPLATPETRRRTSARAAPFWSLTEILSEVGLGAAAARGVATVGRG